MADIERAILYRKLRNCDYIISKPYLNKFYFTHITTPYHYLSIILFDDFIYRGFELITLVVRNNVISRNKS